MNKPLLLLIGTGAALGLNFPLGKLALQAGIEPLLWAAFISLGAGLALLIVTLARSGRPVLSRAFLTFALVSGLLSYVVPNGLTFTVIPRIGSGLAAIMFALSPVFTAALSVVLNVRPPNRMGLAGIAAGFVGALMIVFAQNREIAFSDAIWLFMALLIPLFLAAGNLYRTMGWPEGAAPESLAASTNLAAVPILLGLETLIAGRVDTLPLFNVPLLAFAQLVVSIAMFLMFFRLQQLGGPTYLSQIGYVAAAVGVFIGVAWLGETYPPGVWTGAAVVLAGIALSTLAQARTHTN
jgi:drug/metabolite transporter (DMT)-like permease